MYSQNDEEAWILKHLGWAGTFLDIGANDGVTLSNTRALWDRGWAGVLVEPDPVAYKALTLNVAEAEESALLAAGAMRTINKAVVTGNHNGTVPLYRCSDSLLTSVHGSFNQIKWGRNKEITWTPTEVPAVNPVQLIAEVGCYFNLVSIDTEGTSVDIFNAMPWEQFKCCFMIILEHDGRLDELRQRIANVTPEFHEIAKNTENVVFWRSRI